MLDTSNYLSYLGIHLGTIAPTQERPHRRLTDILLIFESVFVDRHGRKAARNQLPRYCIST